ncbi:hypothetical protein E4U55_000102 [Claviceps digitariae]|nr:hypothetical protein E4U55_000102 [Claviceps digitariae]
MQQASSSRNPEQHLRAQLELLQNHDADVSVASEPRDSRVFLSPSPPPSRAAHGYQELAVASHEAARALGKTGVEAHIHPDLRGAAEHASNMMSLDPPVVGHSPAESPPVPPIPQGPSNVPVAPAPSSSAPDMSVVGESKKAKRELSQSKRAAQNRAAQRAFRQRKEGYIKKLEQQVREYGELEHNFKFVQAENYALRDYVLALQSRLLDTQGEYPPPPPNINISQGIVPPGLAPPPPPPPPPQPQPSVPEQVAPAVGAPTPLEAVAQAVAGLAAQEQLIQCEQQQQQQQQQEQQEQQVDSEQHQHQTYPSPDYKLERCE